MATEVSTGLYNYSHGHQAPRIFM